MERREIDYRAWDYGSKKMYYWDSVDHPFTSEISGTPYPKLFYLPMSYLVGDNNDMHWMEYTGLKDKNGKKIYEGDILTGHNSKYEQSGGEPSIIKWDSESARFRIFRGDTSSGYDLLVEVGWNEVIGNIYEHPELLK